MTTPLLIISMLASMLASTFFMILICSLIFRLFNWIKVRIKIKQDKTVEKIRTQVVYKTIDYDDHKEFVKQEFDSPSSLHKIFAPKRKSNRITPTVSDDDLLRFEEKVKKHSITHNYI